MSLPSLPFHILPFAEQTLYETLSSDCCSPIEVSTSQQARYLARYLADLHAATIVVEYDYTDGDYLEDYAAYYARCFHPYDRRCKRLHFFDSPLTRERFEHLVTLGPGESERKHLAEAYLGFVVARPLPSAVIGRSVLKTYPPDSGRRHYTAIRRYEANLFGTSLTVDSMPFQEQDTVLAACATVALWSAFHKTAELFGTQSPRPAEITKIANGAGNSSRAIPSHGLNLLQMAHAVRSVGLEPEVVPAAPNIPIVSVAYAHLQFGLPVILGVEVENIGLHAVTLAGYSLRKDRANNQEVATGVKCAPFIGLRIDEFYGHDDQIGPFARLRVRPSGPPYPVQFEGAWADSAGRVLAMRPKFLLIPVYNKIRVTFVDIQKWIERLWEALGLVLQDPADFEWDLQLTTTSQLKARLAGELAGQPRLRDLLFRQQPRFVWTATLSFRNGRVFELLADATDMERSLPFFSMIWSDSTIHSAFQALVTAQPLEVLLGQLLGSRFLEFLKQAVKP